MAYFAVQVVSGRELITKGAIEIAASNQNRTDIIEIIVPSKTIIDVTELKSKVKTVTPFISYIFLNIESDNSNYHEMNGDLFRFLSNIPNVCRVLTHSIDRFEIKEMLSAWNDHDLTLLVFKINQESTELRKEKDSILTKMKEKVELNKVISNYKRFVHNVARSGSKHSAAFNYEQTNSGFVVFTPIKFVMAALSKVSITMEEFINAPYKLLHSLTELCYEEYNQS